MENELLKRVEKLEFKVKLLEQIEQERLDKIKKEEERDRQLEKSLANFGSDVNGW